MSVAAEEQLFAELLGEGGCDQPETIFILAAPRTGSTTIYKSMAWFFDLPFIANLTNDNFAETPIIGLAVQKSLASEMSWKTSYGKTKGRLQPSEGSGVLGHWFGGGHPSQIVSHSVKGGMESHLLKSLCAIENLYEAPLVIKNPWNCFRVKYLATALPKARFIWLQRGIIDAAGSDLYARYVTKNTAQSWNSATPANYKELMQRSPIEQVVENQFEFNTAIGHDLKAYAPGRWVNIWLEDYLYDWKNVLQQISAKLSLEMQQKNSNSQSDAIEIKKLSAEENDAITAYVKSDINAERFHNMLYHGAK